MGLPVITLVSPADLGNSNLLVVHFDATYIDTVDALIADTVVFEVDTVNSFNSSDLKTVTYINVAHNTTLTFITTLFNANWNWRVIATNTDGTITSSTYSLTVSQITKRALYQYKNIAKYGPDWINKRALYQYENTAKYGPDWANKRSLYQYENITDDPPFPWIERLSTTRVPEGGLVTIYGAGFGYKYQSDVANEDRFLRGYVGFVKLGTTNCNIVSWSWSEIVFQVPQGASSSGVKVELTAPEPTRESNVIGLEVYMVASDSVGIEFFVCDRMNPNSIVAQLDAAQDKAFQVLLNNPGSGQFNISRYDMKGANR